MLYKSSSGIKKISFLCLILILSLFIQSESGQRFKDQEMMKSHHNEGDLNDDTPLTIHLIQHSHDDVGWLKTVDNYFYGGDTKTQWAGVQYTIDTVVNQLSQNQTYKFSIVEVAFLYRWWNQATQNQKSQMKKLIENKQIQIINGGWCMSDQAAPYYQDVIDQMTIGHRWLKDTFGILPTVAWHIDPFGHQSSSASMFNRMGLQSFFFARIDYQDKAQRLSKKNMQMVWRPSQYNGDSSTYIFTHVNYYHYSAVPGFNFDLKFQDQPIKDDKTLQDYNIDTKADTFVKYFRSMALHYRSSNLMHTMGQDFTHANARMWYKNTDKLMSYINSKPEYNVKIIYSTPGQYIESIQKQGQKYPKKNDDFFPYADVQHGYWTGYFTSRTAVKGFVRDFGKWIQSIRKHLAQLKIANASTYIQQNKQALQKNIWELQMAQGILQHHDGVSGTSKQKVAYDYINTALRAIKQATQTYSKVKSEQFSKQIGQTIAPQTIKYNIFWNQTAKITGLDQSLNNNQVVLVNLYNPGTKGTYQVRLNVPEINLKVVNGRNQAVKGDVICANTYNKQNCQLIMNVPLQESSNYYIKMFKVDDVSDASAKIVNLNQFRIVQKQLNLTISSTATLKITRNNQQFELKFTNGKIETFYVNYKSYDSYQGTGQKSGAYIFRPAIDLPKIYSQSKKIWYAQGSQSTVIVLQNDRTSTKLYFSKISSYIQNYGVQIQTFMDSIPIEDKLGKQITMNVRTFHLGNATFYTDSNGLQEQKRVLNYRPTWNLTVHEPTAGNYYPINSHIRIQDKIDKQNVTIVTERSIGGTVLLQGQFQLMIQRRLLHDDDRGVQQPLNQSQCGQPNKGLTQSIKHYLVFGNKYRQVQRMKDQKPMITYAKSSSKTFTKDIPRTPLFKVPSNVKLYLRMFTDDTYLLRLHNMDMSKPVNITIPTGWAVTELTLSANQLWADWLKKQYKWNQEGVNEQNLQNYNQEIIIDDLQQEKVQTINRHLNLNSLKRQRSLAVNNVLLRPFDLKTYQLTKA